MPETLRGILEALRSGGNSVARLLFRCRRGIRAARLSISDPVGPRDLSSARPGFGVADTASYSKGSSSSNMSENASTLGSGYPSTTSSIDSNFRELVGMSDYSGASGEGVTVLSSGTTWSRTAEARRSTQFRNAKTPSPLYATRNCTIPFIAHTAVFIVKYETRWREQRAAVRSATVGTSGPNKRSLAAT